MNNNFNYKFFIVFAVFVIILGGLVSAVCDSNTQVCKINTLRESDNHGIILDCNGESCDSDSDSVNNFDSKIKESDKHYFISFKDKGTEEFRYKSKYALPDTESFEGFWRETKFPNLLNFSKLNLINYYVPLETKLTNLYDYFNDNNLGNYRVIFASTYFGEELYFKTDNNLMSTLTPISDTWLQMEDHDDPDTNSYFGPNLIYHHGSTNKLYTFNQNKTNIPLEFVCDNYTYFRIKSFTNLIGNTNGGHSGDWDDCIPFIEDTNVNELDKFIFDDSNKGFINTDCGKNDNSNFFQIDLGFNDPFFQETGYNRINKIEFGAQDYSQGVGEFNFLLVCHNPHFPYEREVLCENLINEDAWHPESESVTDDNKKCCYELTQNEIVGEYTCIYDSEDGEYKWTSQDKACCSSFNDYPGTTCNCETLVGLDQVWNYNPTSTINATDGSDGCCGDDVFGNLTRLETCEGEYINCFYSNIYYNFFPGDDREVYPDLEFSYLNDTNSCLNLDNCYVENYTLCECKYHIKTGWYYWHELRPQADNCWTSYGTCEVNETYSICQGDHPSASTYNNSENITNCESQGYNLIEGNTLSASTFYGGYYYNDLYFNDQNNQYVCTIDNEPDTMKLTFAEDEDYTSYKWNWLDAWEESYLIHNLQLPEDKNYNIISNADEWFVCNASGGVGGGSVLGWQTNNSNNKTDSIIGNFDVLPAQGSKEGQCPAGYWFCSCIPEEANEASFDPDDSINIGDNLNCVHPDILNDFGVSEKPYFHPNNKRCVASKYLCNSDNDYLENDEGLCTDINKKVATDACEIEALGMQAYIDNLICPSSSEGSCNGWLSLENIDFSFEFYEGENTLELKTECSNADMSNCLFSTSNIEDCSDSFDNDKDGYVDCEDADCFSDEVECPNYSNPNIEICNDEMDNDGDCCLNFNDNSECIDGLDTNFDDIFCGCSDEGCDFGVDCEDSDCASYSGCQVSYPGVTEFAAPKNESVICYDRSDQSLFTECCDNYGLNCNNMKTLVNMPGINKVDYLTSFIGRGVSLYSIRTFDQIIDDLYTDYVRKIYNSHLSFRLLYSSDSDPNRNLDLSKINYSYYKTLEFDIAYTNLSNLNIKLNYYNSSGEENEFLLNENNFNDFSINGIQNYRWHHIIIPLSILTDLERYNYLFVQIDHDILVIDNIFFGVGNDTSNNPYTNYMCSGTFGYWIDEFDPAETNNPLSCKNVIDSDESKCTACDRTQGTNDCNMTDLVDDLNNNINNLEWYDFDPFKYVCDSYLSYGWTGTKCCGDDTNQTTKEFYNDYNMGGCWDGYIIRNNQRVGETLFFRDVDNDLNRFLYFNGYQICDPNSDEPYGKITFNQNALAGNTSFYVSEDLNLSVYDDQSFTIYNNSVCQIQGNYFCQGDGLWQNEVPGIGVWNPSLSLELKPHPELGIERGGCCPKDYCWNGKECVAAIAYEYNSSKPAFKKSFSGPDHILFSQVDRAKGYRCVYNNTGNAVWENATPKYDVKLDTVGFCKQKDFCFVGKNYPIQTIDRKSLAQKDIIFHNDGCCDLNDDDGTMYLGEILDAETGLGDCLNISGKYYNVSDNSCKLVDCVPSGIRINNEFLVDRYGEYYCDNGNWTSMAAQSAKDICSWLDCDTNKFTLACDKDLIVNDGEKDIADYVHSICTYTNNNEDNEKVLVTYILEKPLFGDDGTSSLLVNLLTPYLTEGGLPPYSCEEDSIVGTSIVECEAEDISERVYYDTSKKILIVTTFDNVGFASLDSTNIIKIIGNFLYGIFHPAFDPNFFTLTGNSVYDKLFMSHNGNNQILAAKENKFEENFAYGIVNKIFINYSSNLRFENILDPKYSALALFEDDVVNKRNLVDEFIVNRCNDNGYALIIEPRVKLHLDTPNFNNDEMLWTYLTKTLRLTSESVNGEIPTGQICTECNDDEDCAGVNVICDEEESICKGDLFYEGCYFNEECASGLICLNNNCTLPECGDSHVYLGEQCDFGDVNGYIGEQCLYSQMESGQSCEYCNASCQYAVYDPGCGDGLINVGEDCELDSDCDGGQSCEGCKCIVISSSECVDGNIDAGEECDNGSLNGNYAQQCSYGIMSDGENCTYCGVDCVNASYIADCGDSLINLGEDCELDSDCDGGQSCDNECKCVSSVLVGCGDGTLNPSEEECDDGNTVDYDGCSTNCEKEYLVFVTSETYDANLGGVVGANQKCQDLADQVGFVGTFYAWIGTNPDDDPESRFTQVNKHYYRIDNLKIADNWDDLIDGDIENPISVDETGISYDENQNVWTNVNESGQTIYDGLADCNDFQNNYPGHTQKMCFVGYLNNLDFSWTHAYSSDYCYEKNRLYCFEVPNP